MRKNGCMRKKETTPFVLNYKLLWSLISWFLSKYRPSSPKATLQVPLLSKRASSSDSPGTGGREISSAGAAKHLNQTTAKAC